ncbi:MAG: hypothetical protein WCD69_16650 [Xanthobacteraceae bacterium]
MISDTMRELNANELEGVSGGGGGVGVGKFMAGPVMTFTPFDWDVPSLFGCPPGDLCA